MSNLNTPFEHNFDSYLDYDQSEFTPIESSTSAAARYTPSLSHQSSIGSAGIFASSSSQTFSGPSFPYEEYRQQTGLPTGSLANTFALNQANGLQYRDNYGFVVPSETLNIPLSNLTEYDFARNPSMDMGDMDQEEESPAMFYPNAGSSSQFVSPTNLMNQGEASFNAPIQRIYPGMHAAQAAQAKKAQESMRQQPQQPKQLAGQKPLPSPSKSQNTKDPLVEETISKFLNQMRRESATKSEEDDDDDNESNAGSMPRIKKDEEEMDEDEKLLASEEGKKLSSKERRQLRNKVSARAFRSRRKEYISQLEGEVAQKVQEANDLRSQNRQLMEENTRLTDLTRMLLSSQAFSGFLQELSQSGQSTNIPAPTQQTFQRSQPQAQVQPQPQPTRKDVNPTEAARQAHIQQQHVGMVLMPEPMMDMSMLESQTSWLAVPSNDFQVFALTELPEAPVLNMDVMSEKPSAVEAPVLSSKQGYPTLSTTSFDDFVAVPESPSSIYSEKSKSGAESQSQLTLTVGSKPDSTQREIPSDSAASWSQLQRMCSILDESCERLSSYMSRFS